MKKSKISSEARALLDANPDFGDMFGPVQDDPSPFMGAVIGLLGGREVVDEALLSRTFQERMLLLIGVANGLIDAGAAKKFRSNWLPMIRPELDEDLFRLRDQLREVWKQPDYSDHIIQEWFSWQPSEKLLALYKQLEFSAPKVPPFQCSVKAARFVPDFASLRAMLIQGVFEHAKNLKICSNPTCVTPYFIAKRRDQTICNNDICREEKQREHARNWWNDNRGKSRKSKGGKL